MGYDHLFRSRKFLESPLVDGMEESKLNPFELSIPGWCLMMS